MTALREFSMSENGAERSKMVEWKLTMPSNQSAQHIEDGYERSTSCTDFGPVLGTSPFTQ